MKNKKVDIAPKNRNANITQRTKRQLDNKKKDNQTTRQTDNNITRQPYKQPDQTFFQLRELHAPFLSYFDNQKLHRGPNGSQGLKISINKIIDIQKLL